MPERPEHANDQEQRPLADLPMGGLLSELLASEGVDPANVIESGNGLGPAGCQDGPAVERAAGPSSAEPATAAADSRASRPTLWPSADVAMPGLFADLMHIDEAARDMDEGLPAPSPASGLAIPGLFSRLSEDEVADEAPEQSAISTRTPLPESAPAADVPPEGREDTGAGSGWPGFDGLAVPELLSLISAGDEPVTAEETDSRQLESASLEIEIQEAVAPALEPPPAEQDLEEEDVPVEAGSISGATEASGRLGIAGLAIPELFSLLSAEAETGSPSADAPAFQPQEILSAPKTVEPALPVHQELDIPVLGDGSAAAQPGGIADGAPNEPVAGLLPSVENGAEVAAGEEDAGHESSAGLEPQGAFTPAAAIAEAYKAASRESAGGDGSGKQNELSRLIDQIDSEINAAPLVPSEAVQNPEQDFERFVVFRLGGSSYGLHMKLVREVEKVGRVTAVPSAPSILRGLINLRGEILPLIDPRPLLGLDPAGWAGGGYLVVVQAHGDDSPVALLVDELGGVAPVDPASVQPVYRSNDLRDVLTGHVLGQAEHRGRSVLLLDHRRLITDEALLDAVEGSRMELEEAGR